MGKFLNIVGGKTPTICFLIHFDRDDMCLVHSDVTLLQYRRYIVPLAVGKWEGAQHPIGAALYYDMNFKLAVF